MSTTTEHTPHLAALAGSEQPAEALSEIGRVYLIGYADGAAQEVARQVAALRSIEDVRTLAAKAGEDYRAGTIDRDEWLRVDRITMEATAALSATVVVDGCPAWCNAHHFVYGDEPGTDVNLHRHLIEGAGWTVELEEGEGATAGTITWIDAAGDEVPLSTARAYAMALLSAVDAVEAG